MDPSPRRLWRAIEGLHAVVYFADEVADAVASTGVRGWWRGYFAGRAAPLGAVSPAAVVATFANFSPAMVERALPSAWEAASPEAVTRARLAGLAVAFERIDGPDGQLTSALEPVVAALDRAADAAPVLGRPLAAAWAAQRTAVLADGGPDVPALIRAWLAVTVLREHRGDAHVAALADAGLDGCEAHLTLAGTGQVPPAELRGARGWSDEEWAAAGDRLVRRGLLDGAGRLTAAGAEVRAAVEAATDRSAGVPWCVLAPHEREAVAARLGPVGSLVVERVPIRVPNPMGWEPLGR